MCFICLFILVLITTSDVASGQSSIVGVQIVGGPVTCSATGNPPGPGLVGVNGTISCDGGNTTLATFVTGALGLFSTGVLPAVQQILSSTGSCAAIVALPVANCTILPSTGILQAPLMMTTTIIQTALGRIAMFVPRVFQLVA
ncbi:hypothetical protein MTR67_040825 [Solanum verrucosum]|uniref:Uncharacterized protein n=1 Tax=Solanum verrucosum TaxID=315347 RepID=A0AAF0UJ80_SOLVR|nr:hypothetical protein MTR67_040825 [Solanum verrucosum]